MKFSSPYPAHVWRHAYPMYDLHNPRDSPKIRIRYTAPIGIKNKNLTRLFSREQINKPLFLFRRILSADAQRTSLWWTHIYSFLCCSTMLPCASDMHVRVSCVVCRMPNAECRNMSANTTSRAHCRPITGPMQATFASLKITLRISQQTNESTNWEMDPER